MEKISAGHYTFESEYEFGEKFSGEIIKRDDNEWRVISDQIEGPSTTTKTLKESQMYLLLFEEYPLYQDKDSNELSFIFEYKDSQVYSGFFTEENDKWKVVLNDFGMFNAEFETLLGAQLFVRSGVFIRNTK